MKASLWERIRFWWCDTFGHSKPMRGSDWEYDGMRHNICRTCGRIYSLPIKGGEAAISGGEGCADSV